MRNLITDSILLSRAHLIGEFQPYLIPLLNLLDPVSRLDFYGNGSPCCSKTPHEHLSTLFFISSVLDFFSINPRCRESAELGRVTNTARKKREWLNAKTPRDSTGEPHAFKSSYAVVRSTSASPGAHQQKMIINANQCQSGA